MVQTTQLPIEHANEQWSTVITADGTVVRARIVIDGIEIVDGQFDQDGSPVVNIHHHIGINITQSAELKQIAASAALANTPNEAKRVLS